MARVLGRFRCPMGTGQAWQLLLPAPLQPHGAVGPAPGEGPGWGHCQQGRAAVPWLELKLLCPFFPSAAAMLRPACSRLRQPAPACQERCGSWGSWLHSLRHPKGGARLPGKIMLYPVGNPWCTFTLNSGLVDSAGYGLPKIALVQERASSSFARGWPTPCAGCLYPAGGHGSGVPVPVPCCPEQALAGAKSGGGKLL